MSEHSAAYCGQCGNPVQKTDGFCGNCGAAVLSTPLQAEQVVPRQEAASYAPTRSRRLPPILLVSVVAILVIAGGAVGVIALQGSDLLGNLGSNRQVAPPLAEGEGEGERETSNEESTSSPTPSESAPPSTVSLDSPASAFAPLLGELQSRTDVPIMLPAELPEKLQNVAISEYSANDSYEVGFLTEASNSIVTSWGRPDSYGTLRAISIEEAVSNEFFEAESVEDVELPDGIVATLRLMNPVNDQAGTQGEYWEGKFQRDGHEYTLIFSDPGRVSKDEVTQALSSMVFVPDEEATQTPESTSEDTEDNEDVEAQEFVFSYYDAVEQQDWATTYSLLADVSQEEFTEEEWIEIQEIRQASEGEPASLESVETEVTEEFVLSADLTFSDGGTGTTTVLYTPSSEEYGRLLTDEDISYLRGFTEDKGNEDLSGDAIVMSGIEASIRDHYGAIGSGDFYTAYSYFGPTFRSENSEEDWVSEEEGYDITSATVNSLEETAVEGDTATATVDVSFEDNTGSPRFLLTWELINEDGTWKLDEVSSSEEL